MKKSRYTQEQIAYVLRQAEAGTPVADVCRGLGISEATFYVWKKKYASLADMLGDTNRIGVFNPNGGSASQNIVGSGSDEMRIASPVSAPATLTIIAIGLAGVSAARRRVTR